MNKNELKKILKPLIKECIKEVIFESGVLSKVVSEVAHGLGNNNPPPLREENSPPVERQFVKEAADSRRTETSSKIHEYKKRFAEQVSRENFGGIDVFEGTTPLSSGGSPGSTQAAGPLANREASDPGIDISGLVGQNSKTWKALINE